MELQDKQIKTAGEGTAKVIASKNPTTDTFLGELHPVALIKTGYKTRDKSLVFAFLVNLALNVSNAEVQLKK